MLKYSVIILIYNRTPELKEMAMDCLASVINTVNREETEIIVVDNGSTERTDYWEKADTYIRLQENKGIAYGWNCGLKAARGQYMAILGDDTIVHGKWLEELQKTMDMPRCGMANLHVQHLPHGEGIVENYKWPSGACFMFNRNTLEKVGYFDEHIWPGNWEDWDYWVRIYKAGLKLYRNYSMTIQHKEGQTTHAKDISEHFERIKHYIIKKHGFDPTPAFCGDANLLKLIDEA